METNDYKASEQPTPSSFHVQHNGQVSGPQDKSVTKSLPQMGSSEVISRVSNTQPSGTSKSHLKGPTAPMTLTPAIAVSLGLPSSNIPNDMKVEVVHLYVVRIPVETQSGQMESQQGNKIFAYDVVTSGSVPPAAEAVASYANQCLLWRSGDDSNGAVNGGVECPERNSALLNLKSRVWQDFVHSTSSSSKVAPSSSNPTIPSVSAVSTSTAVSSVASVGTAPHPPIAPLPSPRPVQPTLPPAPKLVPIRSLPSPIPSPHLSKPGLPASTILPSPPSTVSAQPNPIQSKRPALSSTASANRIRHPWPSVEIKFDTDKVGYAAFPPSSGSGTSHSGLAPLQTTEMTPQQQSARAPPAAPSFLVSSQRGSIASPQHSQHELQLQEQEREHDRDAASSATGGTGNGYVRSSLSTSGHPSLSSMGHSGSSSYGGWTPDAGGRPSGSDHTETTGYRRKRAVDETSRSNMDENGHTQENSVDKRQRSMLDANGFPDTLDQALGVFGFAPLSSISSAATPSLVDFRSLASRLVDEAARNEERMKRIALESSLGGQNRHQKSSAHTDDVTSKQPHSSNTDAAATVVSSSGDNAESGGASSIGTRSGGRRQTQQHHHHVQPSKPTVASGGGKKDQAKEHAEEWVQCDSCARWRLLPAPSHPQYPGELPDTWNCSMNKWNPSQASCSVPEDTSNSSQLSVQRALKLRVWVRRLRSADRFEAKMYRHAHDSDSRPYGEVDWIRCSNPSCGKWRACARYIDGKDLRRKYPVWYCWMNSWDEARSSCGAPQEGTAVHSLADKSQGLGAGEEDDESWGNPDDDDDEGGASDNGLTLQGISSRGRIVRSRWNSSRRRR